MQRSQLFALLAVVSGTGKSRVMEVLNQMVCQSFEHVELPCVVAAPTG